jgi:hypothetical protein
LVSVLTSREDLNHPLFLHLPHDAQSNRWREAKAKAATG